MLFMLTNVVNAQTYQTRLRHVAPDKNVAFTIIQPGDLGYGIGYGHFVSNRMGVYGTLSTGSYNAAQCRIKHHNRYSIGLLYYMPMNIDGSSFFNLYSGYSNHSYYGIKGHVTKAGLASNSFEIGVASGYDHFTGGIRLDVFKCECSLDFGITF